MFYIFLPSLVSDLAGLQASFGEMYLMWISSHSAKAWHLLQTIVFKAVTGNHNWES